MRGGDRVLPAFAVAPAVLGVVLVSTGPRREPLVTRHCVAQPVSVHRQVPVPRVPKLRPPVCVVQVAPGVERRSPRVAGHRSVAVPPAAAVVVLRVVVQPTPVASVLVQPVPDLRASGPLPVLLVVQRRVPPVVAVAVVPGPIPAEGALGTVG